MGRWIEIEEFKGLTFTSIEGEVRDDELIFTSSNGDCYIMFHHQDCCENVLIEDIAGDLSDLIGSPILEAECVTNSEDNPPSDWFESFTWTFYKLGTIKGHVTIRWLGGSNGYYSESVEIKKVAK